MDAAIAWVLKPYMDIVMIEKSARPSFIPALIILFSLIQSFMNYGATYLNDWVGSRITMDLKLKLFTNVMHKDATFFDTHTSGDIQFRFNHDADAACNGLLLNIKTFTTRLFSSMALIFVLFWNSWQLAIIAVIVLTGAFYPISNIRKKISALMGKTIFPSTKVVTHYNEAFGGNRVIRSYNLYEHERRRFKETLENVFRLGIKMTKRTGLISPMMHFIIAIGIAGVIWMGSYLIIEGDLTPGGFVSFITALIMLYNPIKSMGANFTNVQKSLLAMERVFEIIEREPAIKNRQGAAPLKTVKKGIQYRDVNFSYVHGKPVLQNINLDIQVGQIVAFVGNSGGGKTTLVNLLPRFYEIQSGSITIDGVDIRDFDLDSLRANIAIVFQDNFLFAGTIGENILMGRTGVTQKQIDEAIKNACLDEFISSLDRGLDTEIGERGILLSGGQKQRVAIARAFIKNSPIVILDEATSALDNKSEIVVQRAIYNLMENRTVLVIAHRLSTIQNANKIVVVNHGVISEIGTHQELIDKSDGVYQALYRTHN
jgi:subfamily B ATP-binding cassette protein MsbA